LLDGTEEQIEVGVDSLQVLPPELSLDVVDAVSDESAVGVGVDGYEVSLEVGGFDEFDPFLPEDVIELFPSELSFELLSLLL
jgi:hypothetical protein